MANREDDNLTPEFEVVEGTFIDDTDEFTEEIADTATIEEVVGGYIRNVQELFGEALDVSLEGNPVKTHLELQSLAEDVISLACDLQEQLVTRVAVRSEQFPEQGGELLRKQVVENGSAEAEDEPDVEA